MVDHNDPLLTVSEVAEHLRVGSESVRRWLRDGRLAGINLGRGAGWRIQKTEVVRFLAHSGGRTSKDAGNTESRDQNRAEVHVKCVTREALQNPYEGITHLGDGAHTWESSDVIEAIRTEGRTFFTVWQGVRAEVRIYNGPYGEYLRTQVGDVWSDSLLTLPACAQTPASVT